MPAERSRARLVIGVLGVLFIAAGLAWLERAAILTWWRVHQLARASDMNREERAQRVADLGKAALPSLVEILQQADGNACKNAQTGLSALLRRTGSGVAAGEVLDLLGREYSRLSPAGRRAAFELALADGTRQPVDAAAAVRLLTEAGGEREPEVLAVALELASALLVRGHEALRPAREIVRLALQTPSPEIKVRAIQIALNPGMDLFEAVACLLQDPAVEVRRAALLAAGPADKVVLDETLLPCLRDSDPEIQRLAEVALRGRGLTPEHIRLGRLLTDPKPLVRLQVLNQLQYAQDLEPGVWLRRLSHDPAESVRAAAVRVMAEQTVVDLRDRLEQMKSHDPSPSVCWLADYYLRSTQTVRPVER
jgi:hypothetical protein